MNIDIIFLIYYYRCGSDTINSSTLKITWLKALEIKNLSYKLIWSIIIVFHDLILIME
ncbi:protein of unknown function [Clostridium beijerinckii]|nr:protein of unknown function [Clostridium beijerinckii]